MRGKELCDEEQARFDDWSRAGSHGARCDEMYMMLQVWSCRDVQVVVDINASFHMCICTSCSGG